MAELKYPRFNTIYSTREEALSKLKELTRSYGEPVAIRYYNSQKVVCVLLAIFKSEFEGDFEISFDSNPEMVPSVYSITKENPELSDEECIQIALFGKIPVQGDIVLVTELEDGIPIVKSYIYNSNTWKLMSTPSGALSSLNIGNSLVPVIKEDGSADLEVKVDNNTITYDEITGGITVSKLNGGTF